MRLSRANSNPSSNRAIPLSPASLPHWSDYASTPSGFRGSSRPHLPRRAFARVPEIEVLKRLPLRIAIEDGFHPGQDVAALLAKHVPLVW